MAKQYGLIIPGKEKKAPTAPVLRASVFDDDSDSDEEPHRPTGLKPVLKKQDKITQSKALEEDPTVFQYDEVYDDINKQRQESKLSRKDLDRKPKYIARLLQTAERRKKENERRIERQVQLEREAEGEEFKDKEAFVTSSYKKKLEEIKILEEQEKREEYLETIGDVTKQGNLDGFYRHLYDQKVNFDQKPVIKEEPTDEPEKSETVENEALKPENTPPKSDSSPPKTKTRKRHYRNRENSPEKTTLSDSESKKQPLQSNLDADSDFSIDSSSEDESPPKKNSVDVKPTPETPATQKTPEKPLKIEENKENSQNTTEPEKSLEIFFEPKAKKPKIDIWKKRTVEDVFDGALQRFFERKALRESTKTG